MGENVHVNGVALAGFLVSMLFGDSPGQSWQLLTLLLVGYCTCLAVGISHFRWPA